MSTQQFQGPVEMLDGLEMKGTKLRGAILPVVSITDATYTVRAEESGTIFTLNRSAGVVVTLPSATAGLVYEFHIGTTATGTLTVNSAGTDDTLQGVIFTHDKDNLGSVLALNANVDTSGWNSPVAADHQLVLNADTDGRFIGGHVVYKCITAAIWSVSGHLFGDGTATHPFT